MNKWYKEPLVHFLTVGALIFVLYSSVNKEEANYSGNKIVITISDIERLSNNWQKKWNRPPTEEELQGLIQSHIREEVFYREALALGLDRDDTIVRRRMMQKLEFLTTDISDLNEPEESQLTEFFLERQNQYRIPARISFSHIYFNVDKLGPRAEKDALNILSELNTLKEPVSKAFEHGDNFMLGHSFVEETPSNVARLFGEKFADRLFKSNVNTWQGPLESSYGLHLVYIGQKIESQVPEFSEVSEQVRRDWMYEQRQKTNKEIYERFKERYEVVVEDMPEQSGLVKTTESGRRNS